MTEDETTEFTTIASSRDCAIAVNAKGTARVTVGAQELQLTPDLFGQLVAVVWRGVSQIHHDACQHLEGEAPEPRR